MDAASHDAFDAMLSSREKHAPLIRLRHLLPSALGRVLVEQEDESDVPIIFERWDDTFFLRHSSVETTAEGTISVSREMASCIFAAHRFRSAILLPE